MEEILDYSTMDLKRGQLRRRIVRIILPIACVALLMATIVGIALFNYTSNRKDAIALSEDLLRSLDRQIATEVRTFLSTASDLVKIIDGTLKHSAYWDHRRKLGEPLAMHMLKEIPQLTIFSFADTKGNYLMLKKMPDQSIHTKVIQRDAESVNASWIRRNSAGEETEKEMIPDETFDPRTRPWYTGAVAAPGVYWTDVYIFFTDQKPGITVSKAFRSADGELLGVVGVDIALDSLSQFLGTLRIGTSGRAMIIDDSGRLVAFPENERMLEHRNGKLITLKLNELGDPVLDRAYSRLLVEKAGYRELIVNGNIYINTVASLRSTVDKDWSVLIVVPADDFVGFVTRNYHNALLMSVAVLALASLLAALLIWQGLRADRNARLLLSGQREIKIQSEAFSDLATIPGIFDSTETAALEAVTRITTQAVNVRRVSVWHWKDVDRDLICIDCYDRESGGHTRGISLCSEDLPQFFAGLKSESPLQVADALNDPRTAELHRVYLEPLGCTGLLSTAIVDEGNPQGLLWFEQEGRADPWRSEVVAFAQAVAGLLVLRFKAVKDLTVCVPESDISATSRPIPGDRPETQDHAPRGTFGHEVKPLSRVAPDMRTATIVDLRAKQFRNQLAAQASESDRIRADVFEDTTVLVLQFVDPIALATQLDDDLKTCVADQLIHRLENLASENRVEYMKFMSDQLVCAAGCRDDGIVDHTLLIATFALQVQRSCLNLFSKSETPFDFRIGIDSGAVIGSLVGSEKKTYNLWGAAVQTASKMAESGSRGEIHVTESVYQRLESNFLFKVRGRYYLPDIGELSTYILTGRI
jgi:class 3 adenylate cyclase